MEIFLELGRDDRFKELIGSYQRQYFLNLLSVPQERDLFLQEIHRGSGVRIGCSFFKTRVFCCARRTGLKAAHSNF